MPESRNTDSTTHSTLAQLLEVDSQLSIQQAHLQAQLESLQQKRQSLQFVISLFSETDKSQGVAPTQTDNTSQILDESQTVSEPELQESLTVTPPNPTPATVKKPTSSSNKKVRPKKLDRRRKLNQSLDGSIT